MYIFYIFKHCNERYDVACYQEPRHTVKYFMPSTYQSSIKSVAVCPRSAVGRSAGSYQFRGHGRGETTATTSPVSVGTAAVEQRLGVTQQPNGKLVLIK